MIAAEKLNTWIKNNLNVLLIGERGIGKTAIIVEAMKQNGIKFLYFSAATLDPWVDFVGVPNIGEKDDDGNQYLNFIRKQHLVEAECIIFDEYNRAHPKITNAVMELMQFKSINGEKLPNLRMVWGAINPPESDFANYDVEDIDSAKYDRFHVHFEVPYDVYPPYFEEKFGKELAEVATDWWRDNLSQENKYAVSPRRLDYALDFYLKGGDVTDIISTKNAPVALLVKKLNECKPISITFDEEYSKPDQQFKTFINNMDNFAKYRKIMEQDKYKERCLKLLDPEPKSILMGESVIGESEGEHSFDENKNTLKVTLKNESDYSTKEGAESIYALGPFSNFSGLKKWNKEQLNICSLTYFTPKYDSISITNIKRNVTLIKETLCHVEEEFQIKDVIDVYPERKKIVGCINNFILYLVSINKSSYATTVASNLSTTCEYIWNDAELASIFILEKK
jgi:hypothetical protein